VGRSDDLDHARRLISADADLDVHKGALGDLDADLASVAPATQ
jgi:hypothetical protein